MSIEWLLYFIDFLDKTPIILLTLCVISFLISHALDEGRRCKTPWYTLTGIVFLLSGILSFALIPSEKTMYAIVFSHYSNKSDIPEKVIKAIEVKLDDIINQKDKL